MTFSHRNGETEPPTVAGRYWFDGYRIWSDSKGQNVKDIVEINERGWIYNCIGGWTDSLMDFNGKWYGPIVAPWEDCHE